VVQLAQLVSQDFVVQVEVLVRLDQVVGLVPLVLLVRKVLQVLWVGPDRKV